ncbi:MAG: hypothetical protein IKU97_05355, partial [Tidjanibacter sp.]|nr:hypothetical protein [Tidjanibacter sp.]
IDERAYALTKFWNLSQVGTTIVRVADGVIIGAVVGFCATPSAQGTERSAVVIRIAGVFFIRQIVLKG